MQPSPQNHGVDDDREHVGEQVGDQVGAADDRRTAGDDGPRSDQAATGGVVPDLAVLEELTERSPHEHAAVYEQIHAQLQSALSEIDDA